MNEIKPSSYSRQSLSELLARPAAVEILVFAAAVLAFVASSGFQFAYDDRFQIVANPALQSWRGTLGYFSSDVWTSYDPAHAQNYYRPLFFVWFRLNALAFHLQPAGWHLAGVLLHAVASVLAFRVLLRLSGQHFVSSVAALFFAVHPIHIESVAWVSGTTDPLMCVFLLGALLLFLRWMEQPSIAGLAMVAVLFALALLCKEPAIMLLPFLAVWVGIAPDVRLSRRKLFAHGVLPMALVAAIYLALRAYVLHGAAHAVNSLSWAQLVFTLPGVVLFYLRQSVLPIGLSFAYEMPVQSALSGEFFWIPLLTLLLVAALFAAWCWRAPRYRATLIAAAALWLLWLLPLWNLRWLPREELVHDRYLYLPVLGLCLAVGVALAQWKEALAASGETESTPEVPAASSSNAPTAEHPSTTTLLIPRSSRPVALAVVLTVALLAATFLQELDCASDLLIWSRAYRVAPNSDVALSNFATVLFERGRMEEGFTLMQRELVLNPTSKVANFNMAYALHNSHNDRAAEPYAARTVELSPRNAPALRLLGTIELNLGHPEAAEQLLRQAVASAPQGEGFHLALAVVLLQRGNRAEAEQETLAELRLFPQSALAAQFLAQVRGAAR
jgi:tetratricopeptide (TPR) repeat protein